MAAARTAHLKELVEASTDGFNRQVGARGGQLSGGQKQRVAIARAIVKVCMDFPSYSAVVYLLLPKDLSLKIGYARLAISLRFTVRSPSL